MRSICKTVSTIGVVALLLGSAANAADMGRLPSGPPLLQNAPLLVDEFSSGWYLRGDGGYRWNKVDNVDSLGPTPSASNRTLEDSWMIGAGVGYKWEWFRSDLTVDYGTKSRFTADSSLLGTKDFNAKINNATALLNFYGDLGTWWGFTPYIGAGLGGAWVQVSDFHVVSSGVNDSLRSSNWNFAWAYMAGVSYKVAGNYNIDIGYRHVNLGDGLSGIDDLDNQLKFKKMSTDEIRIGFRYVID